MTAATNHGVTTRQEDNLVCSGLNGTRSTDPRYVALRESPSFQLNSPMGLACSATCRFVMPAPSIAIYAVSQFFRTLLGFAR
jgi:hypothetical protein